MELNEKIKALRERYGLTLEDVGNAVGVGKSTVRKWETGDIANMRRDKIAKLAAALHTTPSYLMGWVDDPDAVNTPAVSFSDLNHTEQELISRYRKASDADRAVIDLVLEKYANPASSKKSVV